MHNKSQQYAADGRRTPFPWLLRRHSKVAAVLSVKGLGSGGHWLGAGIGFSGCPQTENIPQSGNGFAGQFDLPPVFNPTAP